MKSIRPYGMTPRRMPVETVPEAANDRTSCLTIMEIGDEEAAIWDEIVALRKAA